MYHYNSANSVVKSQRGTGLLTKTDLVRRTLLLGFQLFPCADVLVRLGRSLPFGQDSLVPYSPVFELLHCSN